MEARRHGVRNEEKTQSMREENLKPTTKMGPIIKTKTYA
jgi:hypothetical protein